MSEIWAGLGPVGHSEKWGRLWATFESGFFMFSGAKKIFNFLKKYCSVRTKKLHKIILIFLFYFLNNSFKLNHGIWIPLIRFSIYLFFHLRCEPSFQNDKSSNPCRPSHCIEVLFKVQTPDIGPKNLKWPHFYPNCFNLLEIKKLFCMLLKYVKEYTLNTIILAFCLTLTLCSIAML